MYADVSTAPQPWKIVYTQCVRVQRPGEREHTTLGARTYIFAVEIEYFEVILLILIIQSTYQVPGTVQLVDQAETKSKTKDLPGMYARKTKS